MVLGEGGGAVEFNMRLLSKRKKSSRSKEEKTATMTTAA